jgi:hypothetical protein
MTDEAAQFFTISLPNPHSSECGSSRERQKTEASKRLTILSKKIEKRMKHIIPIIAVATGLTLVGLTPLFAEEEDEQVIALSDTPAAVQKTFNDEAAGGKIVRVEKEENNYEAVIEKNGKQTGVEVSPDGKVVGRHDESKEHKEKGEKGE